MGCQDRKPITANPWADAKAAFAHVHESLPLGKRVSEIIAIDATRKISASKRK
jgi:hypothetical protein